MALNETRNLYDVLVSQGKLEEAEAAKLRQIQLQSGKSAEELLSDPANGVSESDLIQALAAFHNIPFVDVNETGSAPEALDLLEQSLATRYKMLPFSLDTANNRLLVAMVDPLDLSAITFVEQKTGKRVVAHFAVPSDLARQIEENYSSDITSDVTGAVEETETIVNSQAAVQDLASLNKSDVIKQAPIAKIVEQILGYAVGSNTSDVHIEPQANRMRVRFRIDGMLNEKLILPKSIQDSLVSRVKILANIKIDEKRIPQDGRFNFRSDKGEVDLRVSTLPATNGEKIVMRLLRKMTSIPTLEMLGMSDWAYHHFNEAIHVPHGIILITGPTGSGKTTTLYSAMDIINDKETNIMTL